MVVIPFNVAAACSGIFGIVFMDVFTKTVSCVRSVCRIRENTKGHQDWDNNCHSVEFYCWLDEWNKCY